MDTLDDLIQNENIHYIYQIDDTIFGVKTETPRYVIIAEKLNFLEKELPFSFIAYSTKDWFNNLLNGELIGWVTACINKKYIIKEAVKLLMSFDDICLRKTAELLYHHSVHNYENVRDLKLILQILINHKIVNYNIGQKLIEMSEEELNTTATDTYNHICSLTDIRYKGYLKDRQLKRLKKKDD